MTRAQRKQLREFHKRMILAQTPEEYSAALAERDRFLAPNSNWIADVFQPLPEREAALLRDYL